MKTHPFDRGVDRLRVLRVDSSSRRSESVTRSLTDQLLAALEEVAGRVEVTQNDLAGPTIPFVTEDWIEASYTPAEERTPLQRQILATSDLLVEELREADCLVIGLPIYNFGVPAALKAWVDMVARAGETFRYTEDGPVGLLADKPTYLVVASGGVPVDSEMDFATGYMRQALAFLGITDVQVIAADAMAVRGDEAEEQARETIQRLFRGETHRLAAGE